MDPATLIVCLLAIIVVIGIITGRVDLVQALLLILVVAFIWLVLSPTGLRR